MRSETNFVLHELEEIPDPDGDIAAVLDSCESFVADWHHLDPILDKSPPQLIPAASPGGRNSVVTPDHTKALVAAYRERGFVQLNELGLPFAAQCAAEFTICGAFSSNPFGVFTLTRCAADLLEAHGSTALKSEFLPQLRTGEWMGTMALSEPQAGSSLAAVRTMAAPYTGPDGIPGEFRLRGDKMWTSGAFHDLSVNIVHMLLARTPDAPPGAAGISLFLVPNVLADGTNNDVEVVSLNRKMGHKALSNCAWSLGGGGGGAVGYLVGKQNEGLKCMFKMMNDMRIAVGLSAAALGKRGFQASPLPFPLSPFSCLLSPSGVSRFAFCVSGFGVWRLAFGVCGLRFGVSRCGLWVWGSSFAFGVLSLFLAHSPSQPVGRLAYEGSVSLSLLVGSLTWLLDSRDPHLDPRVYESRLRLLDSRDPHLLTRSGLVDVGFVDSTIPHLVARP
jgi:alkylation response protein AidB-like acyl-CoA dehydrogenase